MELKQQTKVKQMIMRNFRVDNKIFNSDDVVLRELRKKDPDYESLLADLWGNYTTPCDSWGASLMVSINNFDTIESSIGIHPLMFSIIKDMYMLEDMSFLNDLIRTANGEPFLLTQDMEAEYGELDGSIPLETVRLVYITIKLFENYTVKIIPGDTTKLVSTLDFDMDVMRRYIDEKSLTNEELRTFKLSTNSIELYELRCLLVYNGLASHEPKFHITSNHQPLYEYLGKEDDTDISELELFNYYISVLLHSNVENTSMEKLDIINSIISTLGYTGYIDRIDDANGVSLDLEDGIKLKIKDDVINLSKRMQYIHMLKLADNVKTNNKYLRLLVKIRYTIIHDIFKKEFHTA